MRTALLLALGACTPTLQPGDCTADQTYTTECSDCGPTDACIDPVEVCAEICEGEFTPCDDDGGICLGGACLNNVCG